MNPRRAIPSMFHRRLVLLGGCLLLVVATLAAQAVRLTVVEGAERLAKAEEQLIRRTFLPTYRGRILDRTGRVLAVDRASYDVAVPYPVITGTWALQRASRDAREDVEGEWRKLGPTERQELVQQHLPEYERQVENLWRTICRVGDIDRPELNQRLDSIRREVHLMAQAVWRRQRIEQQNKFGDDESFEFDPQPIVEMREAHIVLPQVPDAIAFEFRRIAQSQFQGMLQVIDSHRRAYPWDEVEVVLDRDMLPRALRDEQPMTIQVQGVADHILGNVRTNVYKEDVERRPFRDTETGEIDLGWYRPSGDVVGNRGLEAAFENTLRGERGMIDERKDTGETDRTEPRPGDDLHTTLDIALQARVQGILSPDFGLTRVQPWHGNDNMPEGRPLNAAAVVLDVDTGDILSMVSMPTMHMGEDMSKSKRTINDPWVNRPVEAVYPPGSIIKPLVAIAAHSEGNYQLGETITCTGHFFDHLTDVARCWIYREKWNFMTHGPLALEEALARSCNIFFYTLADRLGVRALLEWYGRFGMGRMLDVGLRQRTTNQDGDTVWLGESAGDLPDPETMKRRADKRFATIIMGIGQGPITWTPMQAANAYAQLAREGQVQDPSIVEQKHRSPRKGKRSDAPVHRHVVEAVKEGLRQSVMESYGTGHHIRYEDRSTEPIFNADNVTVWGKTGTAQAPALPVDPDQDGVLDEDGDGQVDQYITDVEHAWFVGLVGPKGSGKPKYSIAVIVEYGGSGGRCAGPIANQIIHALQEERYLPSGEQESDNENASNQSAQAIDLHVEQHSENHARRFNSASAHTSIFPFLEGGGQGVGGMRNCARAHNSLRSTTSNHSLAHALKWSGNCHTPFDETIQGSDGPT